MAHDVRNAEICRRYAAGEPMQALVEAYALTAERIYQILRKTGGVRRTGPPRSGRDEFLGVELTEEAKVALRAEAQKRGLSMSELSFNTLRSMLRECGYEA